MKRVSNKCGCKCETAMPKNGSLEGYVSWWIAAKRPFLKKMLRFFEEGSLEAVIKRASSIDRSGGAGKYLSHQNCISKKALVKWNRLLLSQMAPISECEEKPFESLLELLKAINKPKSGIGPVTCYDTAFRISAKLKCLPKKVVHLHAGAQIPGAKKKNVTRLVADFPPTVKQRLKAYEIEDFLCVCQKELKESMFGKELKQ